MKQIMNAYTAEDREVWNILFERQIDNLQKKGSQAYLDALQEMKEVLNPDEIPDFTKVNAWFKSRTGWEIKVVPGLIPVENFFTLIANKQFCSSTWLRNKSQLDYLEEPDMFHDIFGHVPLLCNPIFSDFMHEFGKLGVEHIGDEIATVQLQRLYWYTIEFGLIQEEKIKSYGAGIMSSFGETNLIDKGVGNFMPFDIEKLMNLPFQNDAIQENYFVIDSFEELFDSLKIAKKVLKNIKTTKTVDEL